MRSLLAAIMMFTRLPLWRIVNVDKRYFTDVIKYWPLVGFLTGTVTGGVLWLSAQIVPLEVACILAIIARILLTGALHEDGLADFFDGFGGGTFKEKILAIMKDSHIGCYGTIGLVLYFILYYSLLSSFDPAMIFPIVIAADCFSKLCAAVMVNTLPYVRKEEESKIKLVYSKVRAFIFVIVGLITLIPFFFLKDASFCFAMIPAILTAIGLRFFLKIKIGGYTGDWLRCIRVNHRTGLLSECVSDLVSPSIFVLILCILRDHSVNVVKKIEKVTCEMCSKEKLLIFMGKVYYEDLILV